MLNALNCSYRSPSGPLNPSNESTNESSRVDSVHDLLARLQPNATEQIQTLEYQHNAARSKGKLIWKGGELPVATGDMTTKQSIQACEEIATHLPPEQCTALHELLRQAKTVESFGTPEITGHINSFLPGESAATFMYSHKTTRKQLNITGQGSVRVATMNLLSSSEIMELQRVLGRSSLSADDQQVLLGKFNKAMADIKDYLDSPPKHSTEDGSIPDMESVGKIPVDITHDYSASRRGCI